MKYWFWVILGVFLVIFGARQKPKIRTRRLKGSVTGIGDDGTVHVTYYDGEVMYYAHFSPLQIPSYKPPEIGAAAQVIVPAERAGEPITMMLTRSRLKQPALSLPTAGQARFFMIAGAVCIVTGLLAALFEV